MADERTYTFDDILNGQGPSAFEAPEEDTANNPGALRVAGDFAASAASGATGIAQGVVGLSSLAGVDLDEDANNPFALAYQGLGGLQEGIQGLYSDKLREAQANVNAASGVGGTLQAILDNPYSLVGYGGQAVGSVGAIGKAAGTLGRLAPKLSNAGRAAAVEGGVVAGSVAGEIASTEGTTYADRLIGIPAGAASLGVTYLGNRLGGRLDPDSFLAGYFTKGNAAAAGTKAAALQQGLKGGASRTLNALKGAAVEGLEEGTQEVIEAAAVAIGTDTQADLGQAFTIGAVSGGLLGGGFGALRRPGDAGAKPPQNLKDTPNTPQQDQTPSNNKDRLAAIRRKATEAEQAAKYGPDATNAFKIVANYIAAQNTESAQEAQYVVNTAMSELGQLRANRQSVRQFLTKMGATNASQRLKTFEILTAMTQASDPKISKAARAVMQIATGLSPKQLPTYNSRRSLSWVEKAIPKVTQKLKQAESFVKTIGTGDTQLRKQQQARADDARMQLEALYATHKVITAAIAQGVTTRRQQQQRMVDAGVIQKGDPRQDQLDLRAGNEQLVGGESVTLGEEQATPDMTPPTQSLLGDSVPDTGALDLPVTKLRGKNANPNDRLAFVNAVQQRVLDEVSNPEQPIGWTRLMQLSELSDDASLQTIADLTGVPLAKLKAVTKGELTRVGTGQRVSALSLMQERIGEAVQAATQPYREQGIAMIRLAATPRGRQMTPAQLVAAVEGPFKSPRSVPKELRQLVKRARQGEDLNGLIEAFAAPDEAARPAPAPRVPTRPQVAAQQLADELQPPPDEGPPAGKPEGSPAQPSSADPTPRARLDQTPSVAPMEGGLLQRTIQRIVAKWRNVPPIVIVENMQSSKVRQAVRDAMTRLDGLRFMMVGLKGVSGDGAANSALDKARRMDMSGVTPDVILYATGWIKGPDGEWRFEIDDSEAKREMSLEDVARFQNDELIPLQRVLQHPRLYELYPELRDYSVRLMEGPPNGGGSFSRDEKTIRITSGVSMDTLLHEVQHAVQDIEGFPRGLNSAIGFWRVQADKLVRGLKLGDDVDAIDRRSVYYRLAHIQRSLDEKLLRIDLSIAQLLHLFADTVRAGGRTDQLVLQLQDSVMKDGPDALDILQQALGFISLLRVPRGAAYVEYRNDLGEIEANETARRRDLVLMERRLTTPSFRDEYTRDRLPFGDAWRETSSAVSAWLNNLGLDPEDINYALTNHSSSSRPIIRYQRNEVDAAAFFYEGKVYINQSMMFDEAAVGKALYHEIVGHFGLRGVLGDQLNETLDQIWAARADDIRTYASLYNLDVLDLDQRREATEEFLAAKAETLYEQGFLTKVFEAIRAWWADLTGQELTDAQIMRDFIKPAEGFVAVRNAKGMDRDGNVDVRFKALQDERPPYQSELMAKTLEPTGLNDVFTSIGEKMNAVVNYTAFTTTLLHRLARRLPSAQKLIRVLGRAGAIAGDWHRLHGALGQQVAALSLPQQRQLTHALLYYSAHGRRAVPVRLDSARLLQVDETGDPRNWELQERALTDEDVVVDDSIYNTLSDELKQAMVDVFEATSKVLLERTKSRLSMLRRFYIELADAEPADIDLINEQYAAAVNSVIAQHNAQAVGAYVPQSRMGMYRVEMRSQEYKEIENQAIEDGDPAARKKMLEMQTDPNHYIFVTAKSRAEANKRRRQYEADGWNVTFQRNAEVDRDTALGAHNLIKLLTRYEEDVKAISSGTSKLSESIRKEMRRVLVEEGSQNSELTSQMDKRNVAGVPEEQLLDNTLEHIKHFGYAVAAAQTGSDRVAAIKAMRNELSLLEGNENDVETQRFNEVIGRLSQQFDTEEGFFDRLSRGGMGVSSMYYLLTNVTYYVLQLSQSWLMTAPYLSGEFGSKAWSQLTKSFAEIKPIIDKIKQGQTEVTFEDFPDDVREMFETLQERNVLDVGMHHNFGTLSAGPSPLKWVGERLYGLARNVELVNRASAALTAYNLQVDKLTKGKPLKSMGEAKRKAIIEQATQVAEMVTYRTHGDYSFMNASRAFKTPLIRNVMQFKKIAFVVAELLASLAKESVSPPRLSHTVIKVLTDTNNALQLDEDILRRLQPSKKEGLRDRVRIGGWLSDAELEQVRNQISAFLQHESSDIDLTAKQKKRLQQALDSELHPDNFTTRERAAIARRAFAFTLGTSATVSGTISVPFLTSMLAMVLRAIDDEEEELDETSEATVMRVLGPEIGALALRGVMGGVVGIDVSRRVGVNFVEQMLGSVMNAKSRDPVGATNEIIVGLLGPTVSLIQDGSRAVSYLGDYATTGSQHDLMKGIAYASPLGLRNLITGSLMDRQGVMSDSRDPIIPREKLTDMEILLKKVGFSPAKVSEFYDLREFITQAEEAVSDKRLLIKRSYYEAVRDGDTERLNRATKQWREMQEMQRAIGLRPNPMSELREYVRRKRRVESESLQGIQTTSRNRGLVADILRRYGSDFFADPETV